MAEADGGDRTEADNRARVFAPDGACEAEPLRRRRTRRTPAGHGHGARTTAGAAGAALSTAHAPPPTVALDIETTGLSRHHNRVTVVCLYGTCGPLTFNFLRAGSEGEKQALTEALGAVLDAAPRLACFNGSRFDLPFLQVQLGFAPARVGAWVCKCFDLFDIAKGVLRTTFSLDKALRLNGLESKSASGLQAVAWARDPERWDDLEAYCMQDTRLTFELSQRARIELPGGDYCIEQDGARWRVVH